MITHRYLSFLISAIAIVIWTSLPSISRAQRLYERPDFFEQGREQFDQEIQRFQQQEPKPTLSVETATLKWQPVISKAGGFAVWMPLGTMTTETRTLKTKLHTLNFQVTASNLPSSRFVAAYANHPGSESMKNSEAILEATKAAIVNKTGFKVKSDRPLSLNAYPGRELTLQNANETIIFRIYLGRQRLYILASSQQDNESLSQEVTTFLNSFQLLK